MAVIKKFTDGSIIERDKGSFDDWCVYLTRPKGYRYAPKDVDYFHRIIELAKIHTPKKIYMDFVQIFEMTNKETSSNVLHEITGIASSYGNDAIEFDILFTILYLGMVAEENKVNTKLGKRIKRLGMYQILIQNFNAGEAANFSRGMPWREIAKHCEKRGF